MGDMHTGWEHCYPCSYSVSLAFSGEFSWVTNYREGGLQNGRRGASEALHLQKGEKFWGSF